MSKYAPKCNTPQMLKGEGYKYVLILGATSSIARACAEIFSQRKVNLYLASRDVSELKRIADDLSIRFVRSVHYGFFDAEAIATHEEFLQHVLSKMPRLDGVLIATGFMSEGSEQVAKITNINFTGLASILNLCAQYFIHARQKQTSGVELRKAFIAVMSSVAGDRGRRTHFIYNASKAALTVYLQGLRNYLFPHAVQVLTIKLGLVDTRMAWNNPLGILKAQPQNVAKKIICALDKNRNVVYIPWFWRWIMFTVCSIPEAIFKRLKW